MPIKDVHSRTARTLWLLLAFAKMCFFSFPLLPFLGTDCHKFSVFILIERLIVQDRKGKISGELDHLKKRLIWSALITYIAVDDLNQNEGNINNSWSFFAFGGDGCRGACVR